jgi:hypothetical protein
MRLKKWWTVKTSRTGRSLEDSAAGHELWEDTLRVDPARFIPLVWCEGYATVDHGRVSLSSGTTRLRQPESDKLGYNREAFVPSKPWREPAEHEWKRLWQNSGITDVEFVGVAKVPDELLSGISNIVSEGREGALSQVQTDRINELTRPLVDHFCDRFAYPKEPVNHGVSVNMPGLETVTFDAQRRYLGLHLDSWDGRPLKSRAQSLNRISVNIGAEPRYFLFLNLPLMAIARVLALDVGTLYRTLNWLGPAFMSRFPRYPIVRVRIDPGEAYVAPTDNVIHDASTVDCHGPSVSLTLRGWFTRQST